MLCATYTSPISAHCRPVSVPLPPPHTHLFLPSPPSPTHTYFRPPTHTLIQVVSEALQGVWEREANFEREAGPLEEMYALLSKHDVKVPKEEVDMVRLGGVGGVVCGGVGEWREGRDWG